MEAQTCILACEEPITHSKASQDEVWREAMKEEMLAFDRSHTWELVPSPIGFKPIGLKWIFKLKKNPQGEVI